LEILVGHVKGADIVAPLPQIPKLPKKSENNGFKICELI
jgi:hypothetical protein